jgi:hypothetical protein
MLFNIHTVIILALAFMATANPVSPVGEVNARPEMNLEPRSHDKLTFKERGSKNPDDLSPLQQSFVDLLVAKAAQTVANDFHVAANTVVSEAQAALNLLVANDGDITDAVADAIDEAASEGSAKN